jgi:hypothetical protein
MDDQATLEAKNGELANAYRDKAKAQQQLQKLYQSLKAQVMASYVAHAAGDEADIALQTARGDRYVDKLPGARSGNVNYGQSRQGGRQQYHNRNDSGSSGGLGTQRAGGIPLGGLGLGGRGFTGRRSYLGIRFQSRRFTKDSIQILLLPAPALRHRRSIEADCPFSVAARVRMLSTMRRPVQRMIPHNLHRISVWAPGILVASVTG